MSKSAITRERRDIRSDSKFPRFEYLWQDNESFKKPTRLPAPEYVEHLMSWVQSNIDNESMFPSKIGSFEDGNVPRHD